MNANKIVLPKNVAEAIRHYTDLADTKTEAFTDILSLGYEAAQSEIILRHFDHDYDELMEALICGYEVEKTPEEKVREYFAQVKSLRESLLGYSTVEIMRQADRYRVMERAIKDTLDLLGIKIEGVNAE
jgi:DNA integrity scanning protein DisA with diadenylate cyclase activity